MTTPFATGHPVDLSTGPLTGEGSGIRRFLSSVYGEYAESALTRYRDLERRFRSSFGDYPSLFVSAPGRVEIGGNHTDHNNGRIIAASVTLDSVTAAERSDDNTILLSSAGYPELFRVSLEDLRPVKEERGTTAALIRGIAARCAEAGYAVGGFRASVESQVKPGSGLSSSASIEMLIGMILNTLYNRGRIPIEELAVIGQFAENTYFGKPCGLMDQLACGVGGIVVIDFGDALHPSIHRIRHTLDVSGLRLAVVYTGGSHADLTGDYAAIPSEMRAVAEALGGRVCRDIRDEEEIIRALPELRRTVGDRAILRAIHFMRDSERVLEQVRALEEGRVDDFLAHVNASGRSSALWLQNSYPSARPAEQGISLALALTEGFLAKAGRGACRVHGGGFAGTMLAILPESAVEEYRLMVEQVFGEGSLCLLDIRPTGTTAFTRGNMQ